MRITLATWQALGDTIVTLPVAFHLEAQGHEVAIVNTRGRGVPSRRQYVDLLPTYPRFQSCPWGRVIHLQRPSQPPDPDRGVIEEAEPWEIPVAYGRVIDLTSGMPFGWREAEPLVAGIAANARVVLEDSPRVPILAKPPGAEERAAELTGSDAPYVLVAVEGSHTDRALTEAQLSAISNAHRTVLVHHKRREFSCDAVNLTGKTALPSLIDLIAGALAVVSVDTGAWHLAPAMFVPTLGIVSDTSNPAALDGYMPTLYLRSLGGTDLIPPGQIADMLEFLILQQPLSQTPMGPSGLRWWETAEFRTRAHSAEVHQARITGALGGSNVLEVRP